MRRPESLTERLLESWPYALALAPLAAERLGHARLEPRALLVDVLFGGALLLLIAALESRRQALDEVSVTDKLTGLFNSRYLRTELDRQVALAQRARSPLSLIFIDVDDLKRVNDRGGHTAGDELLYVLGRGLLRKVRSGMDLAFRFGGDEFVVLCPQTRLATARGIAERILLLPHRLRDQGVAYATLSAAVVLLRERESPSELLRRADRLLYQAKRAGKSRVVSDAGSERCTAGDEGGLSHGRLREGPEPGAEAALRRRHAPGRAHSPGRQASPPLWGHG